MERAILPAVQWKVSSPLAAAMWNTRTRGDGAMSLCAQRAERLAVRGGSGGGRPTCRRGLWPWCGHWCWPRGRNAVDCSHARPQSSLPPQGHAPALQQSFPAHPRQHCKERPSQRFAPAGGGHCRPRDSCQGLWSLAPSSDSAIGCRQTGFLPLCSPPFACFKALPSTEAPPSPLSTTVCPFLLLARLNSLAALGRPRTAAWKPSGRYYADVCDQRVGGRGRARARSTARL